MKNAQHGAWHNLNCTIFHIQTSIGSTVISDELMGNEVNFHFLSMNLISFTFGLPHVIFPITIPSHSDKESTHEVLPNCASYLQIKLKRVTDGGDHDVAICEVTGTGFWDNDKQTVLWLDENSNNDGQLVALDSSSALYSGQLRQEGII